IVFNVVVLPDPEATTIAASSPRRTASVTPRTANVAPPSNDFDTSSGATTTSASLTPPSSTSPLPVNHVPGNGRTANGSSAGRPAAPTIRVAWNVLPARAPRALAWAPFRAL